MKIAQGLGKLLLAGNAPRQVELSADFGGRVNSVIGPRSAASRRTPSCAGADHGDLLRCVAA
jgi:hypothetical protein